MRNFFHNQLLLLFPALVTYKQRFRLTPEQRKKVVEMIVEQLYNEHGPKAIAYSKAIYDDLVEGLEYDNINALLNNVLYVFNRANSAIQAQ